MMSSSHDDNLQVQAAYSIILVLQLLLGLPNLLQHFENSKASVQLGIQVGLRRKTTANCLLPGNCIPRKLGRLPHWHRSRLDSRVCDAEPVSSESHNQGSQTSTASESHFSLSRASHILTRVCRCCRHHAAHGSLQVLHHPPHAQTKTPPALSNPDCRTKTHHGSPGQVGHCNGSRFDPLIRYIQKQRKHAYAGTLCKSSYTTTVQNSYDPHSHAYEVMNPLSKKRCSHCRRLTCSYWLSLAASFLA